MSSAPRQGQAQRTVATPLRKQSAKDITAFQQGCRTPVACAADARQALSTCASRGPATFFAQSPVRPTPRYGKQGRPGPGASPDQVVYQIAGALASRVATRQGLLDHHSCVILATNELDNTTGPPQEVLDGAQGQARSDRGFRFLKAPQFFAASLYRTKPERLMALLLVRTVCWRVSAALEYRIRTALKDHGATFPNQKGQRMQNPTARWVFHYGAGMHLLCQAGEWPLVLNLTEEHANLLRLLGRPYLWFYDVKYS